MSVSKEAIMEAVDKAKGVSKKRKFKQSVDLILSLRDVDVKKPENRINELVEIPNTFGKKQRVCVIATGELALKAGKAGADRVMRKENLEAFSKDKKTAKKLVDEFDFFVAEAPMMPLIGKTLGAALGPAGKMPTPFPSRGPIGEMIEKYRKMIRIRVWNQPNFQHSVGTEDMPSEKIAENIISVITKLEEKLKRGIKNIRSAKVKLTMGKPVEIKL